MDPTRLVCPPPRPHCRPHSSRGRNFPNRWEKLQCFAVGCYFLRRIGWKRIWIFSGYGGQKRLNPVYLGDFDFIAVEVDCDCTLNSVHRDDQCGLVWARCQYSFQAIEAPASYSDSLAHSQEGVHHQWHSCS